MRQAVVAVLTYLLLKYTRFGRSVYAIGGSRVSAERIGYNVKRTEMLIYAFIGALSGVASLVHTSIYPVDVLVIMLGSNDLKQHFSVGASVIAIGVERIIKAVRNYVDLYPGRYAPKILVVSPILVNKIYEKNDFMMALYA